MTGVPDYMTVAEVSEKIKLRKETIRHEIAAGNLKAVRFGNTYRIAESDVVRWLESHEVTCIGSAKAVSSPDAASAETYALRKVAS